MALTRLSGRHDVGVGVGLVAEMFFVLCVLYSAVFVDGSAGALVIMFESSA